MIPIFPDIEEGRDSLLDESLPAVECLRKMTADPASVIRAVTVTFRPEFHKISPKVLNKIIRNIIKTHVTNAKSKIIVMSNFEFTKQYILHAHLTICCEKRTSLASLCRKFRSSCGYVLVKEPTRLTGWIDYCNKENVYPPRYYYNC